MKYQANENDIKLKSLQSFVIQVTVLKIKLNNNLLLLAEPSYKHLTQMKCLLERNKSSLAVYKANSFWNINNIAPNIYLRTPTRTRKLILLSSIFPDYPVISHNV